MDGINNGGVDEGRVVQERLQAMIGAQLMQITAQAVRIEMLQAKLAKFESEEKK